MSRLNRFIAVSKFTKEVNDKLSEDGYISNEIQGVSMYIEDTILDEPENATIGIITSNLEYGQMIVERAPDVDAIEIYKKYIGAQVKINTGNQIIYGTVVKKEHVMPKGT